MNFSPEVKAWIQLIALALSTGLGVGVTSFVGGSSRGIATLVGVATAATNVYHALNSSPKEKASATQVPFPPTKP